MCRRVQQHRLLKARGGTREDLSPYSAGLRGADHVSLSPWSEYQRFVFILMKTKFVPLRLKYMVRDSVVVKALCYKPEGGGFETMR
jgi:hypothetical protein